MKRERIFQIMGMLSEDIINEAEEENLVMKHSIPWKRYGVVAASVIMCAVVGTGIYLKSRIKPKYQGNKYSFQVDYNDDKAHEQNQNGQLEKLCLFSSFSTDGMGYEGYMAYDISELKNGNPWNESMNITRLPVFKSKLSYDEVGRPIKVDIEPIKKRAYEVAEFLGIDTEKYPVEIHPNKEEINSKVERDSEVGIEFNELDYNILKSATISSDKYNISVDCHVETTIEFVKPFELPEEYKIRGNKQESYEKHLKSQDYIKNTYNKIIPMKNPKANIHGGNYTYDGELGGFNFNFYNDKENDIDKIINYNFNIISIIYNENGDFSGMTIDKPDLSEKLGYYPIITKEKAEELLCKGKYISTVPEKFPGEQYIRKTELVYRNGKDINYMPYYKIYVEIPTMKEDKGLNTYGVFYVPAVEEQYLSDLKVWNGWYN
ncbi:hypothetical protein SAMN02745248_00925 [Hathewaya proteolytica DSM 3090]|uniref:Uncharacterized protein n=1 Tax=Hathewaya proteolytica DSM 3090 TaxID=1121331 RepID=A0A1M6M335_9CLOT|nr:hypothetical protein [Hathewaya proteolytica]SHJ77825.1 hypothetical protein SAMN02745248_00925 [Hathewaya proteolytica DSM 3090]